MRDDLIRSYGRTGGRPLSARQRALIETHLDRLSVTPAAPAACKPSELFGGSPVWLEIGFGGAEHLLAQAARHPDTGLIGCEPFIEGISKAVRGITEQGLGNVRLWPGDARLLIEQLAPASISRVFILFPDPWPKRRHAKRRLIQPEFLDALRRVLAPGAAVRFATDVTGYANSGLLAFTRHNGFAWTAREAGDWTQPPPDHVITRYQAKKLGDTAPVWFDFIAI